MVLMRKKRGEEHLDALRERLYARDVPPRKTERVKLDNPEAEVPTGWSVPETEPDPAPRYEPPVAEPAAPEPRYIKDSMGAKGNTYSYRTKIVLTALAFFLASIMLSSLFILFGGNSISGDNIAITLSGPFTVGGGEDLPLQVGITNQNNVPIESATLIVEYPTGTQAADDSGRELNIERIPLDAIASGETVNVPVRARVFGEEDQEQTVRASIEYRVAGSNATFFKEAEPLRFKISSSPVSLEIDAVEAISSGQETKITLTVRSNSPTPLSNLLVKAEYPSGFDFTASTPGPVAGQNTWRIEEIEPEGSATVEITGVVLGSTEDARAMFFSVGVPNERDPLSLASVFSTATTEFTLEQPFLDVSLSVDGKTGNAMTVAPGKQSIVTVGLENTLDDTLYNAVVEMKLSGNALSDVNVQVSDGFYDSNTRTVVWDGSTLSRLRELAPGASESLRVAIEPDTNALRTPQVGIEVSVRAERTRESRVSEALVGSVRGTVRVASEVALEGSVSHRTGPMPPTVGEVTTYEIGLRASGGSNDAGDVIVSAILPTYVTWIGLASGAGSVSYDPGSRTVTWNAGQVDANSSASASFQVSLLPSVSQIDTNPTLVGEQNLRAEDRFTGTVIRTSSPALTTSSGARDSDETRVVAD